MSKILWSALQRTSAQNAFKTPFGQRMWCSEKVSMYGVFQMVYSKMEHEITHGKRSRLRYKITMYKLKRSVRFFFSNNFNLLQLYIL